MTIQDLNTQLGDLFNSVKDGKIEIDKAKALTNIGATMIKGAKTQLDALKLQDQLGEVPTGIINTTVKQEPKPIKIAPASNQLTMDQFAQSLGYENRLAAIVALKEKEFERQYNASLKSSNNG